MRLVCACVLRQPVVLVASKWKSSVGLRHRLVRHRIWIRIRVCKDNCLLVIHSHCGSGKPMPVCGGRVADSAQHVEKAVSKSCVRSRAYYQVADAVVSNRRAPMQGLKAVD